MSQERNKELSKAFEDLRASVTRLLIDADPVNLIAIGAPKDEYDPEVGTILPRLKEATSPEDVTKIIHEEFTKWFGEDAGPIEAYADVAEQIWNVYRDFVVA